MAHSGLGSIPGPGVTCGLSLLLVLVLAQRIQVSLSLLVFVPPQKKNKQTNKQKTKKQSKFDLEVEDKKNHLVEWPLLNSHSPSHYSRCFQSCVYQLRFLVDSNGRTACNHSAGLLWVFFVVFFGMSHNTPSRVTLCELS